LEVPCSRAKAFEFMAKTFEAGDLVYGLADANSFATEKSWEGVPTAAINKDLVHFAAANFALEALVLLLILGVKAKAAGAGLTLPIYLFHMAGMVHVKILMAIFSPVVVPLAAKLATMALEYFLCCFVFHGWWQRQYCQIRA
jgi:hypothetical protein